MLPKTNEIRVETSNICNFNCIMCPRSGLHRKAEHMDNALFSNILDKVNDELPEISVITVSGFGEPFLDPGWRYKLQSASNQFETVHVVTNLSVPSTSDLDFVLSHASSIRISLYALDSETFIRVHRPKVKIQFSAINEKIHYLINHKEDCKIILNYLVLAENSFQTEEWISFWKDKVDLVEVWKPHNWVNAFEYRQLSSNRLKSCGRPFHGPIQVQVDGTVNICCFDFDGQLEIGDLKHQSFTDIYTSDFCRTIRSYHTEGTTNQLDTCKNCDQRNSVEDSVKNIIYKTSIIYIGI